MRENIPKNIHAKPPAKGGVTAKSAPFEVHGITFKPIRRGPKGCPLRQRLSKSKVRGLQVLINTSLSFEVDNHLGKRRRRWRDEAISYIRSLIRWHEWNAEQRRERRRAGQKRSEAVR